MLVAHLLPIERAAAHQPPSGIFPFVKHDVSHSFPLERGPLDAPYSGVEVDQSKPVERRCDRRPKCPAGDGWGHRDAGDDGG